MQSPEAVPSNSRLDFHIYKAENILSLLPFFPSRQFHTNCGPKLLTTYISVVLLTKLYL